MKTATAETGRTDGRSAHRVAEKMAKSAGVDFEDWVAGAIAEYAEDLGVDPDDLDERERLEAIEDRIDRLARAGSATPQRALARETAPQPARRATPADRLAPREVSRPIRRTDSREPRYEMEEEPEPARNVVRRAEHPVESRDRLAEVIDAIEKRAQRNESRTARALESLTSLVDTRGGDGGRLEATIEKIEKRAELNEERTAKALESLTGLVDSRGGERRRLEETVKQIESRTVRHEERTAKAFESLTELVEARGGERHRLEETIKQIETRAERNEDRTAKALESLASLVESRDGERERLEDAIKQVEARAERNETRTARALESLTGLVDTRGGERERLEEAIKQVEARAERNAERTAQTLESLKGLVETRQGERERLEAAIERIGVRASETEARTAQALQSMTSLLQEKPAERPAAPQVQAPRDVQAGRLDAPARRADSSRINEAEAEARARPGRDARALDGDEDAEALRLVSERLARRRRLRGEAPKPIGVAAAIDELGENVERVRRVSPDPAALAPVEAKLDEISKAVREHDLGGAIGNLQRDLTTLADRVETLSDAAVGSTALEAIRHQADEIQAALAALSRNAAPVERLERQIVDLGARVERFAGAATPADVAAAMKTLSDAQSQIERAAPVAALAAIERRIDELGGRVEAAARRPTLDPRPLEELARRVETIRAAIERQGAKRPDSAALVTALQVINEKIDRASAAGAQSAASMATLQEMTARLEEAIQRPAAVSLDARPIEDLARRIEGVRGAVERQVAVAPKLERLEASVSELTQRLDRPAATANEIAGIEAAMLALATKVDAAADRGAAGEFNTIDELARRIDGVRKAVENNAPLAEQVQRLESALSDIRGRLDRPTHSPQIEAVDATLRRLAEKFEEAVNRPAAAHDPKPIEDLARRIDGVKGIVDRQEPFAPHAARLEAALGEIREKLDQPVKSDAQGLDAAMRQLASRVEEAVKRPTTVAIDPKPIEDLARRIDSMKGAMERQAPFAAHAARLEAALGEIREKLNQPATSDAQGVNAALGQLVSRVEEAVKRPTTVTIDPKPIEDLARRIDSMKGAVERQERRAPDMTRIETALGEIREKLNQPGVADGQAAHLALQQLASRVEEAVKRSPNFAIDPKPIEELARRLDDMKGAMERRERPAPDMARIEAALGEIREKLAEPSLSDKGDVDAALRQLASRVEEVASRPTTVTIDPKPIEDLARRIESVRASLERPQALAPQVERLETALGAVADKLDRAGPLIDSNGLNVTLAAMNARLEEAFRRPTQIAIDREPIDALARRVEAVRETVERQTEHIDEVGRPINDLARRVDAVRESVEKQAEQLDVGKLEETFRAAIAKLDRPSGGLEAGAVVGAIERLTAKVDGGASAFDVSRLETLLQDVAARVESGHGETGLSAVVEAIEALTLRIDRGAPMPEAVRIEGLLEEVLERLDGRGVALRDLPAVVGALQELADRITRVEATSDPAPVEDLLQELAGRLDRLDSKLPLASEANAVSVADRALFEDLVRELIDKVGELGPAADGRGMQQELRQLHDKIGELGAASDLSGMERELQLLHDKVAQLSPAGDSRGMEQELRLLHDKLDDLADARLGGAVVEQAARAIAEKIEQRVSAADPAALLGHVQEIHERLDDLVASRPGAAALERAVTDLVDEMEVMRAAREADSRNASVLADVRADQLQLDRRLDSRFASLREVLESLLERLGRLEREPGAAKSDERKTAPAPIDRPPAAAPPVERLALHDIPDRPEGPRAPTVLPGDTAPLSAQIAAQGRARETTEVAAKNAAISAHIAAARRAANAAAVDAERGPEAETGRKAGAAGGGLGARARAMLAQHRNSVLLGGAAAMALLTGVAVLELRTHSPERKSEIDQPTSPPTSLSDGAPQGKDATPSTYDAMPTGALATASPKVIAAPLPSPTASSAPRPALAPVKPTSELIAAIPAGLPTALAAAGSNGEIGAEVEIAQRYLEGRTVPREPKLAAGWLQAAADGGSPFAQYRLGSLYEKGVGVARDAAKARDWYMKAANAGNVRAMHNLAVLEAQDGGAGKPDYAAALDWFKRAAAYGVRDSQFNLGVLYGRGLGSTQDLASAWMYFSLAAKQGDTDAAHKRDEVANRMDGKVMGAATKLLADFKVKTPDSTVNDPPAAPADAASAPADAPKPGAKAEGKSGEAKI